MAKRGRPSKFNAQRAAVIIEYVRKGNIKETAAKAASITSHTLDNWIAADKAAKKGKFFDFFTALELADTKRRRQAGRTFRAWLCSPKIPSLLSTTDN
jgi:hypothetical protein